MLLALFEYIMNMLRYTNQLAWKVSRLVSPAYIPNISSNLLPTTNFLKWYKSITEPFHITYLIQTGCNSE